MDVVTRTLVGRVPVGGGPIQVFVTPDSKYVLVADQGTKENPSTSVSNTVSVIDIEKRSVISTIPSGEAPNGISFSALPAMPPLSPELELELPEHDTMTHLA